jgi:hypothetical protein
MRRIRITSSAYEAIAASLGSSDGLYEPQACAQGGVFIWIPKATLNQLIALRGKAEEISDVIVRLANLE